MAYLNDIHINIADGTTALKEKCYTPLIIGKSDDEIAIDAAVIGEAGDLTSEGYEVNDPEYIMAGRMFQQSPSPNEAIVLRIASSEDYATVLAELVENGVEFYGVAVDSRVVADIQAVGDWCALNGKVFIGCCDDVAVLTGRANPGEMQIVHDAPTEYPDCALMGKILPKIPGSYTTKFQVLAGINATEATKTELTAIRNANGVAIQEQKGVAFTNDNKSTAGEPLEKVIERDWMEDQIETNLLAALINSDKYGVDTPDIAALAAIVSTQLLRGARNGIVARATTPEEQAKSDDKKYMFQVWFDGRSDMSANDIASGNAYIYFRYARAGAVENIWVDGKITV